MRAVKRHAQVGHRAGDPKDGDGQGQNQPRCRAPDAQVVDGALDHDRQAGQRGLGREGYHLGRGGRAGKAAKTNAAKDHHQRIDDQRDPDAGQRDDAHIVQQDASRAGPCGQPDAQGQGKDPYRRGSQHPANNDDHGFAHGLEEGDQRSPQPLGHLRDGKTEEDGKDHDSQNGVLDRSADRVGRGDGLEKLTKRCRGSDPIRGVRLAGQKSRGPFRIDGPEAEQAIGHSHGIDGRAQDKKAEQDHGTQGQPTGPGRIGDRGNPRHQQGENERNDRHAQGIEPQLANGADEVSGAAPTRQSPGLRRRPCP